MGQKVNPISLRLEKTNRHFDSCWYDDYNYTDLLLQDLKIKNYLKTVLNQINYPEGRILIENLPKKGNIHLFYHNPSLSRRKKKILFQLQNSNYNKKNTKKYKKQSFFAFPELYQKSIHLRDTKSGAFTIAQQTLEEWRNSVTLLLRTYKESEKVEKREENAWNQLKLLQLRKPYESLKSITQTKTPSIQTDTYSKIKKIMASTSDHNQRLLIENAEKVEKNGESSVVSLNKLCYQSHFVCVNNNINQILIDFVLNCREKIKYAKKRDTDEKWVVERFFIRHLLSHLYSRFLQNRSVSNKPSLQKLYQFCFFLFFKLNTNSTYPLVQTKNTKRDKQYRYPVPYQAKRNRDSVPSNVSQKGVNENKKNPLYCSSKIYKSHLQCYLSQQYNTFFNIRFLRTLTEKQGAFFLLQEIIYYLERKVPFRRIKTQILREIPHYKRIKGIRITCSGRVGGRSKKAQRSKTQSVKIGQTPLGVFSSKIDFASKSAHTRFGLVGVKVWVCYQ